MKGETPHIIPDIDPSGGILTIDPLVYGGRLQWRKPHTIAVIRKNAGLLPVDELAAAMGWSQSRLIRIAREEHIDLTYPRSARRKEAEPRGA